MDNKKLASMCPVPPTLRELLKKQKELEMKEKEKYFKPWIDKNTSEFQQEIPQFLMRKD